MNKKLIAALVSSFLIGGTFCKAAASVNLSGGKSIGLKRGLKFKPKATSLEKSLAFLEEVGALLQMRLYDSKKGVCNLLEISKNCIEKNNYRFVKNRLVKLKLLISTLNIEFGSLKSKLKSSIFPCNSTYDFLYRSEKEISLISPLADRFMKNKAKEEMKINFLFQRKFLNEMPFIATSNDFFKILQEDLEYFKKSFSLLQDRNLFDCYLNVVKHLKEELEKEAAPCENKESSSFRPEEEKENFSLRIERAKINKSKKLMEEEKAKREKERIEALMKIEDFYKEINKQIVSLSQFKFFDDLLEISVRE
ncbi:MAG: hypothetical protein LBI77_02145 [Puniceicoccales bacterium]|jgi:hypothetical protein|nr:hypothetical protein [Puniceicoccales bacterium]